MAIFVYLLLASMQHLQSGDLAQALDSATQAIKERPNVWECYQLRSIINTYLGYFTNAERDARKAIQLGPDFSFPYTGLGAAFCVQERLEEASQMYEKAIELAPGYPTYHYELGRLSFYMGRYEKAQQAFTFATKGRLPFPHQTLLLYYFLGKSLEAPGQNEAARQTFAKMKRFRNSLDELKQEFTARPHLFTPMTEADIQELENHLTK